MIGAVPRVPSPRLDDLSPVEKEMVRNHRQTLLAGFMNRWINPREDITVNIPDDGDRPRLVPYATGPLIGIEHRYQFKLSFQGEFAGSLPSIPHIICRGDLASGIIWFRCGPAAAGAPIGSPWEESAILLGPGE